MTRFLLTALLALALAVPLQAQWPEVTVQDIQICPDPATDDDSPMLGDTVQVVGVAQTDARSIYIGARWSVLIADTTGGPWSTVQIVQDDTTSAGMGATNITAVQPGFLVRYSGIVSEYPTSGESRTQVNLMLNPLVPITVLGVEPVPEPTVLTCEDFSTRVLGEPWEASLVKIENATMINNNLGGYRALVQDETGFQVTLDTWWNPMYALLTSGQYSWPPNGSRLDVVGFVKDMANGTGSYSVSPRAPDDLSVHALAPVIGDVVRDVAVPGSSTSVNVSALIYDIDGTVETASLLYRVDGSPFQSTPMVYSGADDSTYAGIIPPQTHNSVVEFLIQATDNSGNTVNWPDSSAYLYLYHVLDEGFGIYHTQWTPYGNGVYNSESPYVGYTVTVTGTVMNDTLPFAGSYYFIQSSGTDPWNGIVVWDSYTVPNPGDLVEVTGVIDEWYYVTRITPQNPAVDVRILSTGNPVYDPVVLTTGALNTAAGLTAESWESMLVRVENATVTNAFPDAPGNYGEFAVDDGSGEYRVDDLALSFDAQLDTLYTEGMKFNFLQGFQYYAFYNYKLAPRGPWDVELGVGTPVHPAKADLVRLLSPFPNPGGSSFTLTYALPAAADVTLGLFDLAGRQVHRFDVGAQAAGTHRMVWNGHDGEGRRVSAGTYLLRLQADDQERSERVVVLH
ncbi:T9SS type A sorting domain-containing protein [Candidatus Fermentibacteria bacterium]|nr:T9SS type A sorting domain-containing protein [Candidatus Fermentibacteria bacterium]